MFHRAAAALALLLALASCQMPVIVAKAVFMDDRFAFVAADESDAAGVACWTDLSVADDSGGAVWRVSGSLGRTCGSSFPILYGRAPTGTRTEVAPVRLEAGRLYLIRGHTDRDVAGAFALTRVGAKLLVQNFDLRHPAVRELQRLAAIADQGSERAP